MPNPYENEARRAKAEKLANLLQGYRITAGQAAAMTQEQWGQLSAAGRVNAPSVTTQAVVVQMLRAREGARMT